MVKKVQQLAQVILSETFRDLFICVIRPFHECQTLRFIICEAFIEVATKV